MVIEGQTAAAHPRPDLRHVRAWIFDLDNTLYPFGSAVLLDAEQRICRFIEERFHLPRAEAWRLQKDCLADHGSTLSGLVARYGIDPESYLAFVNDVDVATLAPAPDLKNALLRLPGARIVFTNNCAHYAGRVLKQLGIAEVFDGVLDIRSIAFAAKPQQSAYEHVLRHLDISPEECAMFEDSERNLVPAHALGMTTVWLKPPGTCSPAPRHVHHHTDDLVQFLKSLEVHTPS